MAVGGNYVTLWMGLLAIDQSVASPVDTCLSIIARLLDLSFSILLPKVSEMRNGKVLIF